MIGEAEEKGVGGRDLQFHVGVRAAWAVGAYLVTALVAAAAIVILRRVISPAALRSLLGFIFIAAIAAGLEPATVKAAALRGGADDAGRDGGIWAVGAPAWLGVGAVKALAVSPLLAVLWRFADPHVSLVDLAWLPAVALAGFAATDQRVLLDIQGRHTAAIWLKQGSLAGGLAGLTALAWAGVPVFWAIGASTAGRLALVAWAAAWTRGAAPVSLARMKALLGDIRWVELAAASLVAALGGSIDRVLALRYLPAAAYPAYYLLYEVFSRFWLAPYLLTPILFARLAAGQESGAFIRRAWLATGAAGALFVAAMAGFCLAAPQALGRLVGASFGLFPVAFAAAVAIGALTQLRIAELQGLGAARRAAVIVGLCAAFAALVFFVFVRRMGAEGLMVAWLIKSVVELAAAMVGGSGGLAGKRL